MPIQFGNAHYTRRANPLYSIAVDTIMDVNLTLCRAYNPNELSITFRRSLYDAISSTALSQLPADRPAKLRCSLKSCLADQIWTSRLSVRSATFACTVAYSS